MVKVPRISQDRVQTAPLGGISVRTGAPIEAFGGGQGVEDVSRAVSGVTKEIRDIALREKRRADNAKNLDSAGQLSAFENTFMNDALSRRGENAFSLPEEFNEKYQAQSEEIAKGLVNDEQRASFAALSQSYKFSMDERINTHVRRETETYYNEKANSLIVNEMNNAINSWDNPLRVQESLDRQRASILQQGADTGKSEEWVQAKTSDAISSTHIGIIDNMISTDSDLAKEYFKANKKEINQKNMNPADLDKKIATLQRQNIFQIEDGLYDKLNDETLTAADVEAVSQPVEQGGIGSKRAKVLLRDIKRTQESKLDEVAESEGREKAEDLVYVDLIDQLIDDKVDNFAMKQILVEAFANKDLSTKERKRLKNISELLKTTKGIQKDIEFLGQDNSLWSFLTGGFKISVESIKKKLKESGIEDSEISQALKKIIDYDVLIDKTPEELYKATNQILLEERVKKRPELSTISESGTVFMDANGNKVRVFPDGREEEVK